MANMSNTPIRIGRYYHTARTAHLERLAEMVPGILFYSATRADFDLESGRGADVRRISLKHLVQWIWLTGQARLEVPEPLALKLLPHLTVIAAAVHLRNLVRPRSGRVSLVSYAIENFDPVSKMIAFSKLPAVFARPVLLMVAGPVLFALDALAFGTDGAYSTYERFFGKRWAKFLKTRKVQLFEALPSPAAMSDQERFGAVFLGTFEDRKGVRELLAAWQDLLQLSPQAELRIIGHGPLRDMVVEFSGRHDGVTLITNPPRSEIMIELNRAKCLVLLSQTTPMWREQVGLPIVEGLSFGCEIVSTDETGIAGWLEANGHRVVPKDASSRTVAITIIEALSSLRSPRELVSLLPTEDSRLRADRWLMLGSQHE